MRLHLHGRRRGKTHTATCVGSSRLLRDVHEPLRKQNRVELSRGHTEWERAPQAIQLEAGEAPSLQNARLGSSALGPAAAAGERGQILRALYSLWVWSHDEHNDTDHVEC